MSELGAAGADIALTKSAQNPGIGLFGPDDMTHDLRLDNLDRSAVNSRSEPINVVIVDDHRMFSECLAQMLADHGIRVVGTTMDGRAALALVAEHQPDVMLIDCQMPQQCGVTTATEVRKFYPNVGTVMLSEVGDTSLALDAINAGCSGFLTKSASAAEVAGAVKASAAGEAHISPALLVRLLRSKHPTPDDTSELTAREQETLTHLARGWTSRVIATEMGLTTSTVRNCVQSILNKLGAHSKLEAVTTAVRRGILTYPPAAS